MLIVLFALIGIFVAVLINRAADNLPPPARRSFFETPRCPNCDAPRTLAEQVGGFRYFKRTRSDPTGRGLFVVHRDKCHQCNTPIPLRVPFVEIVTAALFAFLASRYSFNVYLIIICFFTAILILITVIDLEHKLISLVIILPATLLALLLSSIILVGENFFLEPLKWNQITLSAFGMLVGFAITLAFYGFGILFVRVINRSRKNKITTVAFGRGDVYLAGLLGALIGFPAIFYAILYAVFLGGGGAVLFIILRTLQQGRYTKFTAIPYGPYLILAGYAFLIYGRELLAWILGT